MIRPHERPLTLEAIEDRLAPSAARWGGPPPTGPAQSAPRDNPPPRDSADRVDVRTSGPSRDASRGGPVPIALRSDAPATPSPTAARATAGPSNGNGASADSAGRAAVAALPTGTATTATFAVPPSGVEVRIPVDAPAVDRSARPTRPEATPAGWLYAATSVAAESLAEPADVVPLDDPPPAAEPAGVLERVIDAVIPDGATLAQFVPFDVSALDARVGDLLARLPSLAAAAADGGVDAEGLAWATAVVLLGVGVARSARADRRRTAVDRIALGTGPAFA